MKIDLGKFGTTLTSRQLGKEALAAFRPTLQSVVDGEIVEVDFSGVITFTPSWGDEFLTPLFREFPNRLILVNTKNSSVQATLELLEDVNQIQFKIV